MRQCDPKHTASNLSASFLISLEKSWAAPHRVGPPISWVDGEDLPDSPHSYQYNLITNNNEVKFLKRKWATSFQSRP